MKVRNIPAPIRWPVAIVLLILANRYLLSILRLESDLWGALRGCLLGLPALIAGTILIAPELAALAAAPLNRFIDNVYFPDISEIPPVDYRLARLYRTEGRYPEAIEQYFHILEYHPEELFAYLEGMETAFEGAMPEMAGTLCRKGLHDLSSPEARKQVQHIFDTLAAESSL